MALKFYALFRQNKILTFILLVVIFQIFIYFSLAKYIYDFAKIIKIFQRDDYVTLKHTFKYPDSNLPECSYKKSSLLQGNYTVDLSILTYEEIEQKYPNIQHGGHHYPRNCKAKQNVAILVPAKNRDIHLRIFLNNMHKILQRQYINYIIFVLESFGNGTFNRGKIFNAGFVEAMELYKFDCVILHDVDLIPENDKNIYECSKQPRHMALYINIYNYTFGEPLHLGGATAITVEQFKKINGFNNNFWGHGYEDNDLYSRVYLNNLNVVRYPFEISRYYSFEHERDKLNPINKCNLYLTAYYHYKSKHDGINNLKYKFITLEYHKLFTKIVIDLLENFSRRKLNETIKRYNICDGGGKKELLLLSPLK